VVVSLVAHALLLIAAVAAARPVPRDSAIPSRVIPFHPRPPSTTPASRSARDKTTGTRTDILRVPDGITGDILPRITGEIQIDVGPPGLDGVPVPDFRHHCWIPTLCAVRDTQPLPGLDVVDREVVPFSTNPTPNYPPDLRSARIEGSVVARFVVDTAGRVVMGSVTIVAADHPRFADAVIEALRRSRFRPAELRGRKVAQLVAQPFVFVIRD
jgi:TonB family protein